MLLPSMHDRELHTERFALQCFHMNQVTAQPTCEIMNNKSGFVFSKLGGNSLGGFASSCMASS